MTRSLLTLRAALLAAALASTFATTAARADDKAACVSSYESAQDLRRQNKLRAAREQLLVCTRDACPKLVRTDCTKWMEEVATSLPSLVFVARDGAGRDRADVKVFLDDVLVESQPGQAVPVDPGVHKVRFEAPGLAAQEQEVVVRAGEKDRPVTAAIEAPAKSEPAPAPAPAPPPPAGRPVPLLVPILGGLGLASIGVGGYLALSASSQLDDLRSTCAPHCDQSDVDAVNLRYGVSAGVIGAGVLALGAATWLFVTRPSADHRVGLGVSPRGVTVGGAF